MKKILLYPHGGSGNHGCEALVRSTAKILGNDYQVILASKAPEQDLRYGLGRYCKIINQNSRVSNPINRVIAGLKYRFLGDSLAHERLVYSDILNEVDSDTVCLSFGGDNYCYGKPTYIYIINRLLRAKGAKTYLWGCSIEPDNIDGEMLEDLKSYTGIIARESITYDILRSYGLENVYQKPDPAFTLECNKDANLPIEFKPMNTIGINLSPMAISYSSGSQQILSNYRNFIRHIIESTDMNVALIPHVVWVDNDDRGPLNILYDEFRDTGRVCMIVDNTCEKIKGIISQCRFLIAARTHASIAAYSTGVPTLVMGYSIKAKGIAKDLFGSSDGYVLPVQNLKTERDLIDAFQYIFDNEDAIKKTLANLIPEYVQNAFSMKECLC